MKEKLKKLIKSKIFWSILVLLILASVIIFNWKNIDRWTKTSGVFQEDQVFEVMVVLRERKSADPGALKRGDVISVRPEGHIWSKTEYYSYLLVKVNAKEAEINRLLESLKEGKEEDSQTLAARKYKVDLEKTGFSGDQVINGQSLENEIFEYSDIIVEKE